MKFTFPTLLVVLAAFALTSTAFGQTDVTGSKDYPMINRMPGYYISSYKESQFDSYKFTVTDGKQDKVQEVEGRRYDYQYNLTRNATPASALQIVRNFENAVQMAGGRCSAKRARAMIALPLFGSPKAAARYGLR